VSDRQYLALAKLLGGKCCESKASMLVSRN
jgi:hypothetical protein